MDRRHPICRTCGVQREPDAGRMVCPVCAGERQYVGWGGQRWVSITELHAEGHRGAVREESRGLWGIGVEPSVGIGQRALIVPGPGGNVMFDCVPYVDDATVEAVNAHGGLAAIALSHPHFYGSMVEWSKAFGDIPIYVHEADASWVPRAGNIVLWSGDQREILPERTLVNCGIHFPGGTVLHWPGIDGKGALCTGDIFTVVMDRRWVSFMDSYPNLVPEHPDTIVRAVSLVDPLPYDTVYGGWWGRVVAGGAKDRVRRSADRYLAHVGR
jgi:glyoxylase-like metal-dependent hydrolase (beta-lactamase superfamily II)